MKIRFYFSLFFAKMSALFLKITKLTSGTAIIGLITLKICPKFLEYVNKYILISKINITGTNGKTTSSGIISHLISESGNSIINNSLGANMLNGIVNAIALQLNPFKPVKYSVIETDEAFLDIVYKDLDSDYLLVTNLFEDQTDRFASPLITKSLIQKAVDKKPDLQLILNADEPISASILSKKAPIYFGINNVYDEVSGKQLKMEAHCQCPLCGKNLEYLKVFYSQLGYYKCDCGYVRPKVKYQADVRLYKDYSLLILDNKEYLIPLVGLFNAYNALGAIVLAKELGINNINDNLKTFKVAFGRSEKRNLQGHDTIVQLIKNPAGTNEVLKTVDLDSNILIAVNNNIADGRDISWINQANFEKLADAEKEIVVTGLCCEEMKNRLNTAGVKNIKVISDIAEAVKYLSKNAESDITILTTYTALLKIDKIKEMKKCF